MTFVANINTQIMCYNILIFKILVLYPIATYWLYNGKKTFVVKLFIFQDVSFFKITLVWKHIWWVSFLSVLYLDHQRSRLSEHWLMEIASLIVSYPLTEAGCVVDTRSNLIKKYFDDIRMMAIFHFSEDRKILVFLRRLTGSSLRAFGLIHVKIAMY